MAAVVVEADAAEVAAAQLRPRRGLGGGADTLITLSNGGGDLGTKAKKVVAGLMWPGKPAPRVEPISRTPEQQARYDTGQKLYAQRCAGCRKDQGEGGAEAVALAGSRWVTEQTATLVRIMTAGKEGAAGLMPPLGKTMSDDELAAVLTYVRGSFGNRANPVQAAEVKETRSRIPSAARVPVRSLPFPASTPKRSRGN